MNREWQRRLWMLCWLPLSWCGSAGAQQVWDFRVLLDGKPIGSHRFEITQQDHLRTVHSNADFAVKLLGLTLYRYTHQAQEQWQGDCLRELKSSTQDGGDSYRVNLSASTLPGCIMSYAYWHPQLLQQRQLVNAQTGKIDSVTITAQGSGQIDVRGISVTAQRWRITGLPSPIDLWYASPGGMHRTGEWLGLDAHPDGKLLSYRLQ